MYKTICRECLVILWEAWKHIELKKMKFKAMETMFWKADIKESRFKCRDQSSNGNSTDIGDSVVAKSVRWYGLFVEWLIDGTK